MINEQQIEAASLYLVRVIEGDIKLPQTQNRANSGFVVFGAKNKEVLLNKLKENGDLEQKFTAALTSLIEGKDEDSIKLHLNDEPVGLLSDLLKTMKINWNPFPRADLLMEFNKQGNFLINKEEQNTAAFLATRNAVPSYQ